MADTRCADVELQLDVDVMILEYTLYQATKAQLEALQAEDDGKNIEATRLVLIFDTFVRHFNQHHPDYVKSAQLLFNLKLLEFLVLLSTVRLGEFPDNHAHHLRKEASGNYEARQRWLDARNCQALQPGVLAASSHADLTYRAEHQVHTKWDNCTLNPDTDYDDSTCSLFHLLPRFMEITAEIASLLGGDPNEKWMEIAGEFMLQASVESLRPQVGIDAENSHTLQSRVGLEECFAWGFINYELSRPSITQDQHELDVAINELFRRQSDNSDELLHEENPLWRNMRAKYLSEFIIADDASLQSQEWRLERLAQTYPLDTFHEKLANYIAKVWEGHGQCCGIPVLAEIEQGHIKSLHIEGGDFDNFMVNVGLRKDPSGLLKFKL